MLYNIETKVKRARRLRWAGHLARMEECFQNFNRLTKEERDLWRGLNVD